MVGDRFAPYAGVLVELVLFSLNLAEFLDCAYFLELELTYHQMLMTGFGRFRGGEVASGWVDAQGVGLEKGYYLRLDGGHEAEAVVLEFGEFVGHFLEVLASQLFL